MTVLIYKDNKQRSSFDIRGFEKLMHGNPDALKSISIPIKHTKHGGAYDKQFVNVIDGDRKACIMVFNEDGSGIKNVDIESTTLINTPRSHKYLLNTKFRKDFKVTISIAHHNEIYTYIYEVDRIGFIKNALLNTNFYYDELKLRLLEIIEHSNGYKLLYDNRNFEFTFAWISAIHSLNYCISNIGDLKNNYIAPISFFDNIKPVRQSITSLVGKDFFDENTEALCVPHNQIVNSIYAYRLKLLSQQIIKKYQAFICEISLLKDRYHYYVIMDVYYRTHRQLFKFKVKVDELANSDLPSFLDYDFLCGLSENTYAEFKAPVIM